MSDFETAANYLKNTNVDLVTGTTVDLGTGEVETTTTSMSLREIICSLLAGNGIKLPNLQLCLKINLGRLLGVSGIPPELYKALAEAEAALDEFIAHTNIDNVLGRLNAAIAEFAAIANMINFCGTPVNPKPIPNVLKEIFGSYLGAGKSILDKLGTMLDSDIGGCTGGSGFNAGIFQGGILKSLGDLIDEFGSIANAPQSVIDGLVSELNAFSSDMKNLVTLENNFSGTNSNGGSAFADASTQETHTGVGTAIDTSTLTLAKAQGLAGSLKSAYDSLSGYVVDDQDNNIFDYLLDAQMLAKLKQNDLPTVNVVERTPVYDYCGVVTGYTTAPDYSAPKSEGSPVTVPTAPGITGLAESGTISNNSPATTTNLTNPNPMIRSSVPATNIGSSGDKKGDIASDSTHIYIANADYDGSTAIWVRSAVDQTWS
jgi:hypothetical protein